MTSIFIKRSDEVTARHTELIAEANEALDKIGPRHPATSFGRSWSGSTSCSKSTTRLKLSASPRRSTRHSTSERRS